MSVGTRIHCYTSVSERIVIAGKRNGSVPSGGTYYAMGKAIRPHSSFLASLPLVSHHRVQLLREAVFRYVQVILVLQAHP